jgi:K(+)-stimulated pyrophosphate-energized sodium pump
VRVRRGGTAQGALNRGSLLAAALAAVASLAAAQLLLGGHTAGEVGVAGVVFANLIGLASGVAIGVLTELFTGAGRAPVRAIVRASETGPATNLITGLGLGMLSSVPAVIVVAAAMIASHAFAGMYGVGIAGLGMLSTLGIQLAVDAYGPIADNAGGVAEMAELPPEVRRITDTLDEVGNTTAAVGKGFAIGSAALTAVILFAAFQQRSGLASIDLTDVRVLAGIMLGAAVPYFFSSMSIGAIGRAAFVMIGEVRRQFRERPAILDGSEKPDYDRCIDISTAWALREMVLPGVAAIASPVAAGFLGGIQMLSGLLVGVTASGLILAIFMANSGGAWDNAKKMIESAAGGGKGSPQHHAAVIGDTVGDPFKDTAGPSLNILIKLMSIVSLVILPTLREVWG